MAAEVSALIESLDPFIQGLTSSICPDCKKVCCINRHSYHDYEDIVYLHALGESLPLYQEGIDDSAPCQFLGIQGCTIKRSLRPYRCNWYYCTPLLEELGLTHARLYRKFTGSLHELTIKRDDFMREFEAARARISLQG